MRLELLLTAFSRVLRINAHPISRNHSGSHFSTSVHHRLRVCSVLQSRPTPSAHCSRASYVSIRQPKRLRRLRRPACVQNWF